MIDLGALLLRVGLSLLVHQARPSELDLDRFAGDSEPHAAAVEPTGQAVVSMPST